MSCEEYKVFKHSSGTEHWYLNGKRHRVDGQQLMGLMDMSHGIWMVNSIGSMAQH